VARFTHDENLPCWLKNSITVSHPSSIPSAPSAVVTRFCPQMRSPTMKLPSLLEGFAGYPLAHLNLGQPENTLFRGSHGRRTTEERPAVGRFRSRIMPGRSRLCHFSSGSTKSKTLAK
jgi:hypothetical protein